jgi:hypothetical protein
VRHSLPVLAPTTKYSVSVVELRAPLAQALNGRYHRKRPANRRPHILPHSPAGGDPGGPLACTRKQQLHTWASRVRLDKPLIHHSSALLEGTTGRSASYALGAKDLCDLLCGLGRRLRLTWYSRGANQPTPTSERSRRSARASLCVVSHSSGECTPNDRAASPQQIQSSTAQYWTMLLVHFPS